MVQTGSGEARTSAVAPGMGKWGWTWLKRDHNGLQTVGKPHVLSAWLWHSHPRSHETSHHKGNSLYSEKYTSVLIPPPHPTAFFLQPPVSSPSSALHHYGLFLAWAHRSRWINSCFMALRHLKLIMCKTDLHFSLTNLQLLHFFVFWTSTCQFVRCCSSHLSFLHRSYLQDRPVLLGTYIQHHTLYIHPPHSQRDLTKTRIWYHSKSLWTTSHFSWIMTPVLNWIIAL